MASKKGLNLRITPQIKGFTLVYHKNKYDLWFGDDLIITIDNVKRPSNKIADKLNIAFPKYNDNKKDFPEYVNKIYESILNSMNRADDGFQILQDLFRHIVIKNKAKNHLNNASDKIKNTYVKYDIEEKTSSRPSKAISELLTDNYKNSIDNINNGKTKTLYIDCDILKKYKYAETTLFELLEEKPSELIETFETELYKLLNDGIEEYYVRFDYTGKETKIKELLSHNIGKLIKTTGVVKGLYKITSVLKVGVFECRNCLKLYEVEQPTAFRIVEPAICNESNCGGRSFRLVKSESKYINTRQILIEEPMEDLGNNTNPRNLIVTLQGDGDFINKVNVGDRANITGILDTQRNEKTGAFDFYIKGNNIEKIGDIDLTISEKEEKEIIKLSKDPNILDKLIKSVAPHLILKSELRLGALCSIVGSGDVTIGRHHIHSLIVSDPGTAKSDFFEWILKVVEKGIKTSGSSSSGVGLTGAIDKDPITSNNVLKAGALPLASNGICIGDELDKLPKHEMGKLNNMLEHGYERFNKGGINETLYANTTFIGGANPKYERFDEYKSLKEQINFPPSFLSRMDLIFIVKDKMDKEIINKMLNRYSGNEITENDDPDIIDIDLLKKYLHYAKINFNPILTEEAHEEAYCYLADVIDFMNRNDIRDIVEYTPSRLINSIARLSGAIAKLHLRNEILPSDVKEAIDLKNYCFNLMGYDLENNIIDVDVVSGEISISKREQYQTIFDIINNEKENPDGVYVAGAGVTWKYLKSEFMEITGKSETTFNNRVKELIKDNKLTKKSIGNNKYYDIKTKLEKKI